MPDILHRVGIAARPERVLESLATIDGLRGWWVGNATGDSRTGGTIDFQFCKMEVLEATPEKVHWRCVSGPPEWVGTEVTFALKWKDGKTYRDGADYGHQTFIVFSHSGWKEQVEFMHHCSTKWATFLLSLRDQIEKADGHPTPRDVKIHVGD